MLPNRESRGRLGENVSVVYAVGRGYLKAAGSGERGRVKSVQGMSVKGCCLLRGFSKDDRFGFLGAKEFGNLVPNF